MHSTRTLCQSETKEMPLIPNQNEVPGGTSSVQSDSQKVKCVLDWLAPSTQKELTSISIVLQIWFLVDLVTQQNNREALLAIEV